MTTAKLTTLRAEVQKGCGELDRGRYVDVANADIAQFIEDIGCCAADRVDAEHAG